MTQNRQGAGWHPSAAGQQKFADELVAFLNSDVLVRYVGDEMFETEDKLSDVYGGKVHGNTSRMEMTDNELGLAFKFQINADGIAVTNGNEVDLSNATADVFGDGTQYKLVDMGAIVSNSPNHGDLKLGDAETYNRVTKVQAKYLYSFIGDAATFVVRITNIPTDKEDVIIYARAYYVFEYEGRQITVYDDIMSANYINKYESNDGELEW